MHITTADRRSAHRRVGAAAIAAFLVLLILALLHQPANAEPTTPVATPAASPSQQQQPSQPQQQLPSQPQQTEPGPGFGRDRGFDPRGDDDGGFGRDRGGFGGGGSGGGGATPAPSTGGDQT